MVNEQQNMKIVSLFLGFMTADVNATPASAPAPGPTAVVASHSIVAALVVFVTTDYFVYKMCTTSQPDD